MSSGNFPRDLKVFVYAEESTCLQYYVNCLKLNQYEDITTCSDERQFMFILSQHKHIFDIAVMDVKNPYGYIFQLLSKVDFPFIIISEDKSVASVAKWMGNGACDYLAKPPRYQDLELIYKNVLRAGKKNVVVTGEKVSGEVKSSDRASSSTSKKRRLVWDEHLQKKFTDAMNDLGDEAVPKSILNHMNVEGLTRDQVASHLQKHRLNEKKKIKKSTIPQKRLEDNQLDVFIAIPDNNPGMTNQLENYTAIPDNHSVMDNDQQQGDNQTTNITTQPTSGTYITGHEEWCYNYLESLDSLFTINVD